MEEQAGLAGQFDRARGHLRAVAFRMLGSAAEADDAVQEAWLRAAAAGGEAVANMTGWLTTIVSRVCLDMLRVRRRRGEETVDMAAFDRLVADDQAVTPEDDVMMAESVGLALLVVLDRLRPAERIAYVLHDLFGVPFDEVAAIVGRSPVAAKKLASRARQRVQGTPATPLSAERVRQRAVAEAFLAASRAGDLQALLALLAPDVVRRADRDALRGDDAIELRGARRVAEETLRNADRARVAAVALVNGAIGLVVAPRGRLRLILQLTIDGDRIAALTVVSAPDRLRALRLTVVDSGVADPGVGATRD